MKRTILKTWKSLSLRSVGVVEEKETEVSKLGKADKVGILRQKIMIFLCFSF